MLPVFIIAADNAVYQLSGILFFDLKMQTLNMINTHHAFHGDGSLQ